MDFRKQAKNIRLHIYFEQIILLPGCTKVGQKFTITTFNFVPCSNRFIINIVKDREAEGVYSVSPGHFRSVLNI